MEEKKQTRKEKQLEKHLEAVVEAVLFTMGKSAGHGDHRAGGQLPDVYQDRIL